MENKPKLEPVKLADWIHNSGLVVKGFQQSEKKPSRLQNAETNKAVTLKPIPLSQLNLSFQVLKPRVEQTPARSATSTKKKMWNSSAKIVNKQRRITEIKPHCRQTLTFSSKLKENDTRKTVINKENLHLRKLPKSQCDIGTLDSSKEIKINGIKRLPVTPPNQENVAKKWQNLPKSILQMKLIQDSPLSSPSPKLSDGEASFLRIEKELDDNIVKENELDVNISLPTSTPFQSNKFLTNGNNNKSIFNISNQSENTFVSVCDAYKNALKSYSYKKIDPQIAHACLKSVIEVTQNHLQDYVIENTGQENIRNGNRLSKCSPTFHIKKKMVFRKKIPESTHLSPKVENGDPLNMYMGLKNEFNFLYTPKPNTTKRNEIDSPGRITKCLKFQINKLYEEDKP